MRDRIGKPAVIIAAVVLFGICALALVNHPNIGSLNMSIETPAPPVKLTEKGLYPVAAHPRPAGETELASFAAG
jgi:hypothetical protein